ncbi:MAG: SlyX family protein [Cocleimonas sp.]|nr:SlyX family protein [Cocleimonas sp.]
MKLELLYMEQEDTVQTLSRIVHQQEDKIAQLQKQLLYVAEKLKSTEEGGTDTKEPPPPHY